MLALPLLFGSCLPSLWSPPFFLPAPAPIFFYQAAALAHLGSFLPCNLVLWTDGSVSYSFRKSCFGALANCSLCDTEATLSFSAGPVCSSFCAEACPILQAATSLPFLLSDFCSILATQFSLLFFLLPQTLWQKLSSHSTCTLRLQWVPGHSFLLRNDVADEPARRGTLLVPSVIPCSVSLISRIHSSLFSDCRRTVSSKFFDTQVPLGFHRGTCAPWSRSLCALVYAATNTVLC